MPPCAAKGAGFLVDFVGGEGLETVELDCCAEAGKTCADDD